jgi:hypothetical protein
MARKKKRKTKQSVEVLIRQRAARGEPLFQHPNCRCVAEPIITSLPDFAEVQRLLVAEVARNLSLPPELLRTGASMEVQPMPTPINTTPIGPYSHGPAFPGYWSGQYRDEAYVELSLRFYYDEFARTGPARLRDHLSRHCGFKPWLYTRMRLDELNQRIVFWQDNIAYPRPELPTIVMSAHYSPVGFDRVEFSTSEQGPFDDTSFLICMKDHPICFIRGVFPALADLICEAPAEQTLMVLYHALIHILGIVRRNFVVPFNQENIVLVCTQRMGMAWKIFNVSQVINWPQSTFQHFGNSFFHFAQIEPWPFEKLQMCWLEQNGYSRQQFRQDFDAAERYIRQQLMEQSSMPDQGQDKQKKDFVCEGCCGLVLSGCGVLNNKVGPRFRTRDQEDVMKLCFHSLSVAVVLGLTLPACLGLSRAEEKPKPVKAEKTWDGKVNIELRKEAPKKGHIADKDAWAKLWKVYRREEKLPEVDFEKELILVAVNSDPNQIFICPEVDDKGDLKVLYARTAIRFINPTTCAYQFALIKREGIKTISGKVISKD